MTITDTPRGDASGGHALWHRARPLPVVLVGLAVACVCAVWVVGYVLTYQPLASDGGMYWAGELTDDQSTFAMAMTGRLLDNAFGTESRVGPMPHGGRLGFIITLHNRGRFPVKVEGVAPVLPEQLSHGTQMFVARDETDPAATLAPAGEFTMPAHEYRTVGFAVDVRDCEPGYPGVTVPADKVSLTYRFAGTQHTTTIRLDEHAVTLASPPRCD